MTAGTGPGGSPPPPPPAPYNCRAGVNRCELSTITASQLSAAIILFVYVMVRVYLVASANGTDPIAIQITVASAATIIYIFLCFWLVEDDLIDELRNLRRPYNWAEFGFRVILLVVLALLPNFVEEWIPSLLSDFVRINGFAPTGADAIVVFLAILFLMFLLWDTIIYFGAPTSSEAERDAIRTIARTYYKSDVVGFLVLVVVEVFRFISQGVASILLIVFILFAARQVGLVGREMWNSHFAGGMSRTLWR